VFDELGWGLVDHANCQDTLAESIREYGLTPDDVHDSFNLWMATAIDENGHRQFKWNPAQAGERIDLLAMFDVLAVAVICGCGDLVGINNYTFTPVKLEVLEASPGTIDLVDEVEQRWGRMRSQDTVDDALAMPVHAARELRADPEYQPRFRPVPARQRLQVDVTAEDQGLINGLLASGLYGEDAGEAIRAAFMRWCNRHVTRVRRTYLEFTDNRR
jgi:hypothetical protein